jgi:hypothetical protein
MQACCSTLTALTLLPAHHSASTVHPAVTIRERDATVRHPHAPMGLKVKTLLMQVSLHFCAIWRSAFAAVCLHVSVQLDLGIAQPD